MNLSAIAIRRPVFVVMVTLGFVVLGLVGFTRLGTDLFPDVNFPVVVVNIVYPGASPSEVESLVTKQVEDAVVSINNIDRVRSFSREGLSTVMVIFKLSASITESATQVRERIAQIRAKLPREVLEPAVMRFDVGAVPVAIYTVGGQRPLSEIRKFAEDVIKPGLEQIDGVAAINVEGGAEREISVRLDRARLDALGIDALSVVQRLQAANLTVPAGHYSEGVREVSVRTIGDFADVEAIRDVIVASAFDGSAVRLRDIADVEDGFKEMRTRIRVNGEEAVSFSVQKQSGENTVRVVEKVMAKLAVLEKAFPSDIRVAQIIDQARFINSNAHEVEVAIVFGGAMAILVILLFMLDLRSTLISALALPTSVIATFFAMYAFNFTLNMMTLLGLSLAIGLLIDDAVVVRENIFKHLERGKSPWEAALDGTKEVALSVLATTLTVIAVFLPVAFVEGIVGQFFRQFGITISCAVALSLLVAFTLDPMLSARFSKSLHEKDSRFDGLKRPFIMVFDALDETYRLLLGWAVRHKLLVGLASVGALVLMGFVSGIMGNEFVNAEDRGQYAVDIELPAGTSLSESARVSARAEAQLQAHPETRTIFTTLGVDGQSNHVRWRVILSKKQERTMNLAELKDVGRKVVPLFPEGTKLSITDPPFIEGAQVEAPIMINVRGNQHAEIAATADQIGQILRQTPGVGDVQVKYSPGHPELQIKVDNERAADQRVFVAQIAMALRTAMEGEEAGKLRQGKDEIPIRVRLKDADRSDPSLLAELSVPTPKGPARLSELVDFVRGEGPQVIEREDRSRQIQVWAAPQGRPLGDIVAEVEPKFKALKMAPGTTITYDGQIRLMNETNSNMGLALLLGVVFIYIVLASQFESFIHPVTIMLTLPLAMVGAVISLFLTGRTMAMGALIGIILLMGLVTKNAILLVDRAIVRVREHGQTPLEAILAAGPERLRPILMTSAAMVLGMLPTAISQGEGSEFRSPMAIAIIGGVISSTMLSLIVVPAFYLAIENAKAKLFGSKPAATVTPKVVEEA
ncbi:MAG: efflux RND transporter permease subunit [Myxococcota bacterium]